MNIFKCTRKRQYLIFLLVAILLIACETEKNIPTTVSSEPEKLISQIAETTAAPSLSIGEASLLSRYQFENLPHLYLTVDPVIPPFNSKILSISPEIIVNNLYTRKTNLVSDDYEFLEREPNLTWSSNFEKAVFVNMDGLHLYSYESNEFTNIYSKSSVHLPIFWNSDNSRLIYTIENGRGFSGDVFLLNSDTRDGKRYEFPENMMPGILGWIDRENILLTVNESGLKPGLQKMELLDRNLIMLNTMNGDSTEIDFSGDWFFSEGWRLSPDGKKLFFRTYPNAPDSYEKKSANILNLQTNSVEILDLPKGEFKWLPSSEDFLLIDYGFDNPAQITWYINRLPRQSFGFEEGAAISSLLITPDGNGAVVFLTNKIYQSDRAFGYKAIFVTIEGRLNQFLIPGLNAEDWKVVFASWGE